MEHDLCYSLFLCRSDVAEGLASLMSRIKCHAEKKQSLGGRLSWLKQDRPLQECTREWREIGQVCLEELTKDKSEENNKENEEIPDLFKNVAENIHHIADTLPIYGATVDVYLWPLIDTDGNKDYVHYLGALRRMKDWHNAKFTIIEAEPTANTEFLQRFLSANICIDPVQIVFVDETILWRGKVSVCNKIENSGVTIPGVCLCMTEDSAPLQYPLNRSQGKDRSQSLQTGRVGRTFEVLDEVSLSTISALMKTQYSYKIYLYQRHPYSQVLLNYIQENSDTGLLARLPIYPHDIEPVTCNETNLSTNMWKENVMADIQFVQEPEEDLQDSYEYIYFIITSPDKNSSLAGNQAGVCYLLQHPYHLNGSLLRMIYHQSLTPFRQEPDGATFDLIGCSVMSCDLLREVEQDLCVLRRQLLQNWIIEKQSKGESTEVHVEELLSKFKNIQINYLNKLREKLPQCEGNTPTLKLDLQKNLTEITENTYDWPERLILQYEESQKRSLSRIQSSESVAMSSPIQPTESRSNETATTVDIQSFLKFFHPDGSASNDSLSPVRRRHPSRAQSKLIQPDSNSPHFMSWPESKDTLSHDIYYNIDKKSEKLNNHLNKIREKFIKNETYSSCQSAAIFFPKCDKKKQRSRDANQDLRRSPRKKQPPAFNNENAPATQPQRKPRDRFPRLSDSFTTPLSAVQETTKRRFSTSNAPPSQSHMINNVPNKGGSKRRKSEVVTNKTTEDDRARKESRSERHKRRLQDIVDIVLIENGVERNDTIFKSSSARLFKVTKLFVMDLPNSRNLKDEMRKIAESQVQNVMLIFHNRHLTAADRSVSWS